MIDNKTNNTPDNTIIYFTRLNWVIFFWPILALCFTMTLFSYSTQFQQIILFFIGFAFLWILMTWITYHFSSITIKRKQVILRTGMLIRQTVDIPLSKIETIDIRQSIVGSILRYGALVITGTGGTRHVINYIDKPLTCRRYIEQLMNQL